MKEFSPFRKEWIRYLKHNITTIKPYVNSNGSIQHQLTKWNFLFYAMARGADVSGTYRGAVNDLLTLNEHSDYIVWTGRSLHLYSKNHNTACPDYIAVPLFGILPYSFQGVLVRGSDAILEIRNVISSEAKKYI